MTADEYLVSLRWLDIDLQADYDRLASLRAAIDGVSGIRYDKDKVKSSLSGDQLADKIARAVDLESQIKVRILDRQTRKAEGKNMIEQIDNGSYRQLLTLRYIDGKSWTQISRAMNFSDDHSRGALHRAAKAAFAGVYNLTQNNTSTCDTL